MINPSFILILAQNRDKETCQKVSDTCRLIQRFFDGANVEIEAFDALPGEVDGHLYIALMVRSSCFEMGIQAPEGVFIQVLNWPEQTPDALLHRFEFTTFGGTSGGFDMGKIVKVRDAVTGLCVTGPRGILCGVESRRTAAAYLTARLLANPILTYAGETMNAPKTKPLTICPHCKRPWPRISETHPPRNEPHHNPYTPYHFPIRSGDPGWTPPNKQG